MNEQKHIINRQVLEITIPNRDLVQPIQNKASEIIKYRLHPALDVLFSKMAGSDEIIRIDKMIIDLGTVTENELGNVLVEATVKQIRDKIDGLKIKEEKGKVQKSVNGDRLGTTEEFTITSRSKDTMAQFVYYLQFGHFPWWHKSLGKNNLEEIFAKALKHDTALFRNAIIPLLANPSVRQRLIFQFNHSQLYALLEKINYQLIKSYFTWFLVLLSLIKTSQKRKEITGRFYEIALQYFSVERELINEDLKIAFVKDIIDLYLTKHYVTDKETILAEIIQSLQLREIIETPNDANLTMVALIQVALELPNQSQHLQLIIQDTYTANGVVIKKLVKKYTKKTKRKTVNKRTVKKAGSVKGIEKGTEMIITDNINDIKNEKRDKSISLFPPNTSDDSDEIVISNAGLVLIHPFLRYFFEGLNLLDEKLQFKNQSSVFKAIHLLQFIATGQEDTNEAELPLNKILCGRDVAEAIPKRGLLLDKEKEECIYLINTVLERWDALKTTNPKALRKTYLLREGILKQSGESWNLIIERNSFDVMLEKLPWSINLIKLPWLQQILYVEW